MSKQKYSLKKSQIFHPQTDLLLNWIVEFFSLFSQPRKCHHSIDQILIEVNFEKLLKVTLELSSDDYDEYGFGDDNLFFTNLGTFLVFFIIWEGIHKVY